VELLKTNIMGFTTPCFIRKNTPELRNKLEELGYKYSTFDDLKLDGIITFPSKNDFSIFANYHFDKTVESKIVDDKYYKCWYIYSEASDPADSSKYYYFVYVEEVPDEIVKIIESQKIFAKYMKEK
jgi:hypothetical protein